MVVELNKLMDTLEYIKQINDSDLKDLVVVKGDKKVEFKKGDADDWGCAGFNNVDFIKELYLRTKTGE